MWLQKEQLSVAQILDFVIIVTMAALWAVVPSDGLAVVTSWFYHKVIDVRLVPVIHLKLDSRHCDILSMYSYKACTSSLTEYPSVLFIKTFAIMLICSGSAAFAVQQKVGSGSR